MANMVPTSLRNGSIMDLKWYQHGCQIGPGGLLEASWRSLAALKRAWSAKGGLPGAYGALLVPKKEVLNGSWPLQEEFQDRFQPSRGPKAPEREAKRVQNRVQEATRAENTTSSKNNVFFQYKSLFFKVPGSIFGCQNRYKMASDCRLGA